jgi:hypothetical protein
MRWVFGIIITAGLAAFFLRVFESLSADAIGMALGVLFGVTASLPVALLILAATRSQRQAPPPREPRPEPTHQRPMIVMMPSTPQQPQQQLSQWSVAPTAPPPPRLLTTSKGDSDVEQPGKFRIIGEEGEAW